MKFRIAIKYLMIVLWIVGICSAFYYVAPRSLRIAQSDTYINIAPPLASLNPKFIKVITLGHKDVYDAFVFMWMIQVVANPDLSAYHERLDEVARFVVAQEPGHESLYMLLCLTLASPRLKHPETCRIINETGLKLFPQSWRLAMIQGYIEAFEMKDKARAALFYSLAASRKESPEYVGKLAKRLINDETVSESEIAEAWKMAVNFEGWEKFQEIMSMKMEKKLKGIESHDK